MRSQRYEAFVFESTDLDTILVSEETENSTLNITRLGPNEYGYEYHKETELGTLDAKGHLFIVDHPDPDKIVILLGTGFTANRIRQVPRFLFTERGYDVDDHRLTLSPAERWALVEYVDGATLDDVAFTHPSYGTDDIYDMAEDIAVNSSQSAIDVYDELRAELIENQYPIERIQIGIEGVCEYLAFESDGAFSPRPLGEENRFTEEQAERLVNVILEVTSE